MLRRLFNLAAAVTLALCVAIIVVRQCATNQIGVTFGAPGGRLVVLKADGARDGARGTIAVYRNWKTVEGRGEPLRASWNAGYIGPSGKAGGITMWTSARFRLLFEWGESYVYVAPDGRTPLFGPAAINSFNASTSPTPFRLLIFPLGLLIAATAALPAAAGSAALLRYSLRVRRRRARAANRCERCGYDLRATPDRCPECGLPAPTPAPPPAAPTSASPAAPGV